jgi:hypothetical protein
MQLRSRLERRELDCERRIERFRTRAICLGQDRDCRVYWLLAGDKRRIYVQIPVRIVEELHASQCIHSFSYESPRADSG